MGIISEVVKATRLYNALGNLYGTDDVEHMISLAAHDNFVDRKLLDHDPDLWNKVNNEWNDSGIDVFRNL